MADALETNPDFLLCQFLMLHKPELLAKYGKPFIIGTVAA